MEVTCPKCSSRFNLPDKLARPGAKLRCAVCKHVFQLPGGAAEGKKQAEMPDLPKPKKSKLKYWIFLSLLGALLAGGGTWLWMEWRAASDAASQVAPDVELLTMRNVRQYNVLNEKIGKVFVIEGRVVNEFPEAKGLIELEGALYDKNRKTLAEKKQMAGTQLSLFQLQVLNEKEMNSFLNNKVELLDNNTHVPPGGEVPFMILFYDPPNNVAEFGVKIVGVQDSPQN